MPADRPTIPIETKREVLYEARHHCAVCCEALPLEYAHIIPWRTSQNHSVENLIALCANCHERADKEKWGIGYLQRYKRQPCMLARGAPAVLTPEQKAVVDLIIARNPEEMTYRERQRLVSMVAAYVGVAVGEIKIVSVLPANSSRIRLALPLYAAKRIIDGFKAADPLLYSFLSEANLLRVEPYTLTRDRSLYAKLTLIMRFLRSWRIATSGYLHSINQLASIFGLGFFTLEFFAKVHTTTIERGGIWVPENWFIYIFSHPQVVALILLIDWIFVSQRNLMRFDEAIVPTLFGANERPSSNELHVMVAVVWQSVLFALLAVFSDRIIIVSALFTFVSLNDLRTRILINRTLERYILEDAPGSRKSDDNRIFIHRRRSVAAAFLRDRPQVKADLWNAIGCSAATIFSIAGYVLGRPSFDEIAYLILILTLLIHQVITVQWRAQFYLELAVIGEASPVRVETKPAQL